MFGLNSRMEKGALTMYEKINPIQQFNFQINRVLTYGETACHKEDVRQKFPHVKTLEEWYVAWTDLSDKARKNEQYLHAAYYDRMAEFFLKHGDPRKEAAFQLCLKEFEQGYHQQGIVYERPKIPFETGYMKCVRMCPSNAAYTIVICGGYDSFIEEFILQIHSLYSAGYDIILFEGPGQGECIRQKLYFRYDFEKATTAVLNFFSIQECAMVGISWGGYFALRSAAFDKRIKKAVAYDVLDDGLAVMTNAFPFLIRRLIQFDVTHCKKEHVNNLFQKITTKSVLADWMVTQGKYITGTQTFFDMMKSLQKHTLKGLEKNLTQDILLLGGEKDHYIPKSQFYRCRKSLTYAKSLSYHMFTQEEGGEQHCQVGNHMAAIHYIIHWLQSSL